MAGLSKGLGVGLENNSYNKYPTLNHQLWTANYIGTEHFGYLGVPFFTIYTLSEKDISSFYEYVNKYPDNIPENALSSQDQQFSEFRFESNFTVNNPHGKTWSQLLETLQIYYDDLCVQLAELEYNVAENEGKTSLQDLRDVKKNPYQISELNEILFGSLYQEKNDQIVYDYGALKTIKQNLITYGILTLSSAKANQNCGNDYGERPDVGNIEWDRKNDAQYIAYGSENRFAADLQVALVGYDDDYSKENFGEGDALSMPSANGAFLVKGSLGDQAYNHTQDKPNGYYWISYYDASINEIAAVNAQKKSYDKVGYLDDSGYLYGMFAHKTGTNKSYMANIFRNHFDKAHRHLGFALKVQQVSYVTPEEHMNVKIMIYKDVNSYTGPLSGKLVATEQKYQEFPGIHTLKLSKDVLLKESDVNYAVVVELTRLNDHSGYSVMTAETSYDFSGDLGPTYFEFARFQSYVSFDGKNYFDWYDFHPDQTPSDLGDNIYYGNKGNFNIKTYSDYVIPKS
jgi:hypothetical protein